MWRKMALTVLLLSGLMLKPALAIDVYEFDDPVNQQRFDTLADELRCPKCQNQNIADSNAPLAKDLKNKIYDFVQQGKSDEEIVQYLKERYGDFVTYRPPFKLQTLLLWLGPFIVLFVSIGFIVLMVRKKSGSTVTAELTDAEKLRLDKLTKQTDGDK